MPVAPADPIPRGTLARHHFDDLSHAVGPAGPRPVYHQMIGNLCVHVMTSRMAIGSYAVRLEENVGRHR